MTEVKEEYFNFRGKMVYICAPYRADTEEGIKSNIQFAVECGRWVLRHYGIPFVPHINTMHLFGLEANDADVVPYDDFMVEQCAYILVCGDRISNGMRHEINLCSTSGEARIFKLLKSPYEDNQSESKS